MPDRPEPVLGERFLEAVAYAVELHREQARKGTSIPYLTHLFSVCSLVLEDGGTENEAIAALLHDGPEDQGGEPILAEIRRRFGDDVAAMVDGLSDSLTGIDEEKESWRPRKERYLERLAAEPESVLRVSLADKLHNARSMAIDVASHGAALWKRFHADRDDQAWYFRSLLAIFREHLPKSRNLPEFEALVQELFVEKEWRVYVLELEDGAGPGRLPDKPNVYVGQTALTVQQRLGTHLTDSVRGSRPVRKHFRAIRPDLAEGLGPYFSAEDALRAEAALEKDLKRRGFVVVNKTGKPRGRTKARKKAVAPAVEV
jgi:hypothetical protein